MTKRIAIGSLGCVLALATAAGAQSLPMGIPDLCVGPTITAVANGGWSAAATWSPARVPTVGDRVRVPAGRSVTYDRVADDKLACLGIAGLLTFRTTGNTRLKVGTTYVYLGGELRIGTAATPLPSTVRAEFIIGDQALDTGTDPEQYGTGILVFGMVRIAGTPKLTFTRVAPDPAAEPLAGAASLTLSEAPLGWQLGDRIVLPDTRQMMWSDKIWDERRSEELTVAAINGTVVGLTAPLRWDHKGARDLAGHLDFQPHVGNLTRNVVIRSENPNGTRGHLLATHRADVDIRYASFVGLGRTTYLPLDSTTFDGQGRVTHIGTNEIGRYPIHMHHVFGPSTPPANGYQFTLIGNAVDDASKWGIAIHDSSFGLIQDNVVFNSNGACIVTEDGSETQNVFNHNFVLKSYGEGGREGMGREGNGFWFRGADNIVTNNVASTIRSNEFDAAYGYKYFLQYLGNVRTPKFRGADTTVDANVTVQNGNAIPVRKFENNEVYGATESGLTFWWIGTVAESPVANMPESVFKDLKVWHVFNRGVYHYPAQKITVDGLIMRSSRQEAGLNGLCCQLGIDFGDYYGKDITYRHVDIQGRTAGIVGSILTDGSTVTIEDSTLKNQVNFSSPMMSNVSYSAEILRPRHYVLRNVKMATTEEIDRFQPTANITVGYSADPVRAVTLLDDIRVENYQGVPGDSFRVYRVQQAPDYIVPQSMFNGDGTRSLIGAPVAGLTNQQTWDRFQVAVGGAVAPCAITRPDVDGGFTCPLTGGPRTPRAATGPVVVTQ
jgi:hypothetical protein